MATHSNSPLLPSMHCAGNFVLEFPSINSPILTLTHARATKLVVSSTDLARMRHRENRRDREFMLGNSRMKLPDAVHARQERWVWGGCGLAASAAPVVVTVLQPVPLFLIPGFALFYKCTFNLDFSTLYIHSTQCKHLFQWRSNGMVSVVRRWVETSQVVVSKTVPKESMH